MVDDVRPLLIGADLRKATPETYQILGNKDLITLDQDELGKQATVLASEGGRWTLVKELANGDRAVALFNETGQPQRITTSARQVGLPQADGYRLRDLWQHSDQHTSGTISATVPAHGTTVYRVSADRRWADYPPAVEAGTDGTPLVENATPTGLRSTVGNLGGTPARDVRVTLRAPDGWQVSATSPPTPARCPAARRCAPTGRSPRLPGRSQGVTN